MAIAPMPEMNLNHIEAKKQTQKTLTLLCIVCVQTLRGCWVVEKRGKERGGRQIKDPKKSKVKREKRKL